MNKIDFPAVLLLAIITDGAVAKLNLASPLAPTKRATNVWCFQKKSNDSCSRKLPELRVQAFLPYGGPFIPMGTICTEGIEIALDAAKAANNSLTISDKYDIVFENYNGNCSRPDGVPLFIRKMREATDRTENIAPIVMLSMCADAQHNGMMLHHFDVIGLAPTNNAMEVYSNRNMYKSFFPITNSVYNVYKILAQFIELNGWKRVALLSETQTYFYELEEMFFEELRIRNITFLTAIRFPMAAGTIPDNATIDAAVRDLRWKDDPRIIVLQSSTPALVACYLHRYGMYGPQYVILLRGGYFFLPNSPLRYSWCSEVMVYEVLRSVIYFGDGSFYIKDGEWNDEDAVGISHLKYDTELRNRINNVEGNSIWQFIRTLCYDVALSIVYVLDAVEKRLNSERNETLLEWVMKEKKFQENSDFLLDFMRQTLKTVRVRTPDGDIDLTEYQDQTVSKSGALPTIFQVQNDSEVVIPGGVKVDVSKLKIIVVMQHAAQKNPTLVFGPGTLRWSTENGQPPPDSQRTLLVQTPMINEAAFIALTCCTAILTALEVAVIVTFGLVILKLKPNLINVKQPIAGLYICMMAGNILMNVYVLVLEPCGRSADLPQQESRFISCSLGLGCFFAGYTLAIGSVNILLELGLIFTIQRRSRKMAELLMAQHQAEMGANEPAEANDVLDEQEPGENNNDLQHNGGGTSEVPPPVQGLPALMSYAQLESLPVKAMAFLGVWLTTSVILTAIAFGVDPVEKVVVLTGLPARSKSDPSLLYQYFSEIYRISFNVREGSIGAVAALIWFGIHCIAILRALFLSFYLRKYKFRRLPLLPHICSAGYLDNFLVIAATTIIAIRFSSDDESLTMTASAAILLFSTINLSLAGGLIFHRRVTVRPERRH